MEHNHEEARATNLYYDRNFQISSVKILPGEYYVTNKDMAMVTVLGSCVSACIRDRESGIGGMNHFMLPDSGDGGNPYGSSARYGTYAMEILINQLLKMGARRYQLEAKVFGGGSVLPGISTSKVGERNATFVREYLRVEKIPIVAEDLLDVYPRKLYFFAQTGRVLMRKLHRVHNDTVSRREQDYNSRLTHNSLAGDIELFS